MIWNSIRNDIFLEKSNLFLKWGISNFELSKTGNTIIEKQDGRIKIIWKDESLLSGIKGDWYVTFLKMKNLNRLIQLIYITQKTLFLLIYFETIKSHLIKNLGFSEIQQDANGK